MGGCLGLCFSFLFSLLLGASGVALYAANPPEVTNILILGTDERPGTNESQIARTDSIMILSVNPQNQHVSLLSLPRDVFITSPNYGLLRANTVVRNAELNTAGTGVQEMIASMELTFGIEIHHYVRLSFEAFVDVVDALDGVTIDVPKRIVDNSYPTADYGTMRIEFQQGKQHMDGENALIYARTRHADDDYQRAARQQQVLEALVSKLSNPLNLPRWPKMWWAFQQNVETDMHLGDWAMLSPGFLLYGRTPSQIEKMVIERENVVAGGGGVVPNMRTIEPWIVEHLES